MLVFYKYYLTESYAIGPTVLPFSLIRNWSLVKLSKLPAQLQKNQEWSLGNLTPELMLSNARPCLGPWAFTLAPPVIIPGWDSGLQS